MVFVWRKLERRAQLHRPHGCFGCDLEHRTGLWLFDPGLPVEGAILVQHPPQRHDSGLDAATAARKLPARPQLLADLPLEEVLLTRREHGVVALARTRRWARVVGLLGRRIGRIRRALLGRILVEKCSEPIGCFLFLLLLFLFALLLGELLFLFRLLLLFAFFFSSAFFLASSALRCSSAAFFISSNFFFSSASFCASSTTGSGGSPASFSAMGSVFGGGGSAFFSSGGFASVFSGSGGGAAGGVGAVTGFGFSASRRDCSGLGSSFAFASSSLAVSLPFLRRKNSDGVIMATAIGSGSGGLSSRVDAIASQAQKIRAA